MRHRPPAEERLKRSKPSGTRFVFYGRQAFNGPSYLRQLGRVWTLLEPCGGDIVATFFDIDTSPSVHWSDCAEACALIGMLKRFDRGFDAVVFGLSHQEAHALFDPDFPLFRIPLWMPVFEPPQRLGGTHGPMIGSAADDEQAGEK
jgi:site-specific DNA recombinase